MGNSVGAGAVVKVATPARNHLFGAFFDHCGTGVALGRAYLYVPSGDGASGVAAPEVSGCCFSGCHIGSFGSGAVALLATCYTTGTTIEHTHRKNVLINTSSAEKTERNKQLALCEAVVV